LLSGGSSGALGVPWGRLWVTPRALSLPAVGLSSGFFSVGIPDNTDGIPGILIINWIKNEDSYLGPFLFLFKGRNRICQLLLTLPRGGAGGLWGPGRAPWALFTVGFSSNGVYIPKCLQVLLCSGVSGAWGVFCGWLFGVLGGAGWDQEADIGHFRARTRTRMKNKNKNIPAKNKEYPR